MSDLDLILDIIFMAIFIPTALWFWFWFVPRFNYEMFRRISKFFSSRKSMQTQKELTEDERAKIYFEKIEKEKKKEKIYSDIKAFFQLSIVISIPIVLIIYFYEGNWLNDPILAVFFLIVVMPAGYMFMFEVMPKLLSKLYYPKKENEDWEEERVREDNREEMTLVLSVLFLIAFSIGVPVWLLS